MSLSIPLSPESMLGIGIGLAAVGVILWKSPAGVRVRHVSAVGRLLFAAASFAIFVDILTLL